MMLVFILPMALVLLLFVAVWLWLEGSFIPRQSTRAFWNLSKTPLSKKIEGYFYGAKTSLYLKPATWLWFLARNAGNETADSYHGKVLVGPDAVKLVEVNIPVTLTDLEHVIPYPAAREIVLGSRNNAIAVLRCPCREQKSDACEPRDVCLVIGEPFVSFVVDHQPNKARMITTEEAAGILEAEEQRGHIHTAWFKDAMHGRFYAICNCCGCCCLGMRSLARGVPRIAHSGYRPTIDRISCTGCADCVRICPFNAVRISGKGKPEFYLDACMGCGLCASHCRSGALELKLAPDRGIPLAIDMLMRDNH